LAITKERKEEVLTQYADWMKRSQAVILVEYTGVTMKALDNIRAKVRETGGEFHVVKNTLARRAFADMGMQFPSDYLVKSTAVSFAFNDPALTAKALTDATKGSEFVKVKGGFMSGQTLNAAPNPHVVWLLFSRLSQRKQMPRRSRLEYCAHYKNLSLSKEYLSNG
jgi:large subunit ribosomal protein L10